MSKKREQTSSGESFHAFEKLHGQWLIARGRHSEDDVGDAEAVALCDTESALALAIAGTPANVAHQVFVKFELLEYYFDDANWCDQRDMRLLASIKADLRKLLP
jgi:hypothetical protein